MKISARRGLKFIDLPAIRVAEGTVRLPGSKSISNRILLLAALADGPTEICDLLASYVTVRMLDALVVLGVPIVHAVRVHYRVLGLGSLLLLRSTVCSATLILGHTRL